MKSSKLLEETQKLKSILNSTDLYKKGIIPYKTAIQQDEQDQIALVVDTVKEIISNRYDYKPMTHLNALRVLKETVDGKNISIQNMVAETILPILEEIAQFNKAYKGENRGKFYFSDNPDNENTVYGDSFLRLVMECIAVWGTFFRNTPYQELQYSLKTQNIQFPSQYNYFKEKDIKKIQENLAIINKGQTPQDNSQQPKSIHQQVQKQMSLCQKVRKKIQEILSLNDSQSSYSQLETLVKKIAKIQKIFEETIQQAYNDEIYQNSEEFDQIQGQLFVDQEFLINFVKDMEDADQKSGNDQEYVYKHIFDKYYEQLNQNNNEDQEYQQKENYVASKQSDAEEYEVNQQAQQKHDDLIKASEIQYEEAQYQMEEYKEQPQSPPPIKQQTFSLNTPTPINLDIYGSNQTPIEDVKAPQLNLTLDIIPKGSPQKMQQILLADQNKHKTAMKSGSNFSKLDLNSSYSNTNLTRFNITQKSFMKILDNNQDIDELTQIKNENVKLNQKIQQQELEIQSLKNDKKRLEQIIKDSEQRQYE